MLWYYPAPFFELNSFKKFKISDVQAYIRF